MKPGAMKYFLRFPYGSRYRERVAPEGQVIAHTVEAPRGYHFANNSRNNRYKFADMPTSFRFGQDFERWLVKDDR